MNKLHQRNLPVPYFSQRENKYVWKELYATDIINPNIGKIEPTRQEVPLALKQCKMELLTIGAGSEDE